MPDELNARIKRVEDELKDELKDLRSIVREDVHDLHNKMDRLISAVTTLQTTQGIDDVRSQGKLDALESKMCPDPGACIRLTPRIDKLEREYGLMRDMVQQAKGGGKVIAGLWGAVGAFLTILIWAAKEYFTRK